MGERPEVPNGENGEVADRLVRMPAVALDRFGG